MDEHSAPRFLVLLIEDNPGDRFLLSEMIDREARSRFEVAHSVAFLEPGLEVLRAGGMDIVLLDLSLPDSFGLETFRRARAASPTVPIVVLSGLDDEEMGLETMRLGAQEYLVKGRIDAGLLHRAMRYAIERARFEADLARERELFHTLADHVPDRIYFKDRESRFIRVNRAMMRLFAVESPEQALGKSDADFFGLEHARGTRRDELQVMETGEPILDKVELEITASGQRSWLLTTKLPLTDGAGQVVGTCGISREITKLKALEEQLAAEGSLLRSVIDNLPDLIYLKDSEGRYLLDNVAHQRWLRASSQEDVLGRTVFDFYPDDIASSFQADDTAILASGQALLNRGERILGADGQDRWALTTKVPWHDETGAVRGLVCISRDVTEQKKAEADLRQANADLARSREEVLGAMGKLQAAHRELRDVQLQLIEAEKMKSIGRLAAGIAHEVQNPLAILKLGIQFFESQAAAQDATERSVLADMADAVNRADGVIRGLLDFSAPKRLEVAASDLNGVLERAITLVRGELKSIELVNELEPGLPLLKLDGGKIGQVFINLLTNAIHAMPRGGCLTVRTYARQLTGVGTNIADSRSESFRVGKTLVVAEIDDTGTGIPEDKLPKIFEPFFTTKPTGKGTGLGLSVVRTIVDLHGGTVDIRNLPEGGARVTLMFQV